MKKGIHIGFCIIAIALILPVSVFAAGSLGVNVNTPLYSSDVASAGVMKSQLHFSKEGNDVGGYIISALDNNFYMSSGVAYDETLGGWIQKSPDGKSVIAGSQSYDGYTIFMQQGNSLGSSISVSPKFQILYNGYVGFGRANPQFPIHMAGGARCTGTTWLNASSRDYKDNVRELSSSEALLAFNKLNPVTFSYKAEQGETHVGFIAEDVPDLIATPDRKALSTMDIVAVLTKVVQEQQRVIDELKAKVIKLEQSK